MDISDVSYRYSGGASNSDPGASTGGAKSSVSPGVQGFTSLTNPTGVTLAEVGGCEEGTATVEYNIYYGLRFLPPNKYSGPYMQTSGHGDRSYFLVGPQGVDSGYALVDVVETSLPGSDSSGTSTITTPSNQLFDDITIAEAASGVTQYRCIYIHNEHGTDNIVKIDAYIMSDTEGEDTIGVAFDTDAGVDGTAATLVDENDSTDLLSGLTFTTATDPDSGVTFSTTIAAGSHIPVWIRRVVPAGVEREVINNDFNVGFRIYVDA